MSQLLRELIIDRMRNDSRDFERMGRVWARTNLPTTRAEEMVAQVGRLLNDSPLAVATRIGNTNQAQRVTVQQQDAVNAMYGTLVEFAKFLDGLRDMGVELSTLEGPDSVTYRFKFPAA